MDAPMTPSPMNPMFLLMSRLYRHEQPQDQRHRHPTDQPPPRQSREGRVRG